jgi:hypothetical protein
MDDIAWSIVSRHCQIGSHYLPSYKQNHQKGRVQTTGRICGHITQQCLPIASFA